MVNHKISELSMKDQEPADTPESPGADVEMPIKNGNTSETHQESNKTDTKSPIDTEAASTDDDKSDANNTTSTAPINIATLHPHHTGSPSLPLLPLLTSTHQIPNRFAAGSTHLTALHALLAPLPIPLHAPPVALHRLHADQMPSKHTLTLVIQSDSAARDTWAHALTAISSYLAQHTLGLVVEIIDRRIMRGMYTLPILATDPLATFVAKKKSGISRVLDEELGEGGWVSCGFWYRGTGATREACRGTVVVGVKDGVDGGKLVECAEKVEEKIKERMGVEFVWGEGGKW